MPQRRLVVPDCVVRRRNTREYLEGCVMVAQMSFQRRVNAGTYPLSWRNDVILTAPRSHVAVVPSLNVRVTSSCEVAEAGCS